MLLLVDASFHVNEKCTKICHHQMSERGAAKSYSTCSDVWPLCARHEGLSHISPSVVVLSPLTCVNSVRLENSRAKA